MIDFKFISRDHPAKGFIPHSSSKIEFSSLTLIQENIEETIKVKKYLEHWSYLHTRYKIGLPNKIINYDNLKSYRNYPKFLRSLNLVRN